MVDADPFLHWFDPKRLRKICFKRGCVDSGFWLSRGMRKAGVHYAMQTDLEPVPVGIVPLEWEKDLKVGEFCGMDKLVDDGSRKKTLIQ